MTSQDDFIEVIGCRQHNLKNISVKIPKNKLIVVTGLSGSGKSSLAFDTIYAEGQRRYIESLSTYARQFLNVQTKPEADYITFGNFENDERKDIPYYNLITMNGFDGLSSSRDPNRSKRLAENVEDDIREILKYHINDSNTENK